ncbi:MAG TPA: GFA family protein [Rhizomicrobium sp.]
MVAPFQGGCLCGAIRYESSSEPFAVMECHCRDCQHSTGGASTVAVLLPKPAFALIQGTPKSYTVTGDNGGAVTRFFCAECGSPLYSLPANAPLAVVKAGSMDDPSWLKLGGALYTSSAQPWAHIDRDLPMFEKMPPMG